MKKIVAFAMLCCLMLTMCTFVVAEPEGHNWDAGTWVDTPTCQHPGQIEYKCLNEGCNATKEVKVREVECSYRAATCEVAERCRWCNEKKPGSKKLGHDFPPVACMEQKCRRTDCRETIAGTGKHRYTEATCEVASQCEVCHTPNPNGSALGHNFTAATCNAPATCTRCKKTEGNKKTHSYFPATCTQLATCRHCGETTGTYKDHNFQNGKCTVCNKPQYALDDEPNEEDDLMVLAAQ